MKRDEAQNVVHALVDMIAEAMKFREIALQTISPAHSEEYKAAYERGEAACKAVEDALCAVGEKPE